MTHEPDAIAIVLICVISCVGAYALGVVAGKDEIYSSCEKYGAHLHNDKALLCRVANPKNEQPNAKQLET